VGGRGGGGGGREWRERECGGGERDSFGKEASNLLSLEDYQQKRELRRFSALKKKGMFWLAIENSISKPTIRIVFLEKRKRGGYLGKSRGTPLGTRRFSP